MPAQTVSVGPITTRQTGRASPPQRDHSYVDRLEWSLQRLDYLCGILQEEFNYTVPPLPYPLPEGFRLTVVVPVYNERRTIHLVLARLSALPIPTEIIVVDDYSCDGTADELLKLSHLPELKIILKGTNEGKGAALRTAFPQASGDVVIVQDADLEYDPRDIPILLQPIIEDRADVVYGSRFSRPGAVGSSWWHQGGNRFLTAVSNLTTGLRLTDMETCYKAFRRDLLLGIDLKQNRFGFEPEITAKIARRRARIAELPIDYRARDWKEGKKIGLGDAISAIGCIFRYAWWD
jgi:glycosyltransferase involved in cell wall biosynthesis